MPGKSLCGPQPVSRPVPVHVISKGVPARESIPNPLRMSISGPSAIHVATDAARNFAERIGIEGVDASRLAIIVEELVTNLYDHGGLQADDAFEIELSTSRTDINVTIVDRGKAFDPGAASFSSTVPARGGGAGLRLLRDWATQAQYRSNASENRLLVVLPRSTRRSGAEEL